jgi:UDP:flavonoid glycosyltransferase YjiC (YdhE family)
MARVVFVTWDGGGNVSVALAIARALVEREHDVTVLGPATLRGSIEENGLAYAELGVSPPLDSSSRSQYLEEVVGSSRLAGGLHSLVAKLRPEAVVIDCNLSWALQEPLMVPVAVLVHTALGLYLPVWQPVIDAANRSRKAVGLDGLEPAAVTWFSRDALIVTSLLAFDRPPAALPADAVYVGPVRRPERRGTSSAIPHRQSTIPLVLVSYSTDRLQSSPERLQRALDGLADLEIKVIATTSGAFEAEQLSVPPNATVVDDLAHGQVMPTAQAAVVHAGHGTTLAALCHGLPLVCVPGLGRDQEPIARRVAELGLGVALARDATAEEIGAAVSLLLDDRAYRQRARAFERRCGDRDGASAAADVVEHLLLSR